MNKKLFSFGVGIFLFLLMANFISAESQEINYSYSYSYGGVQVTSLKYEPYPTNPGEYFDVWLKLNIGSVKYAKVEFIENFPFSLDENEDAVREYEDFSGDVVLHYKIRVDDNAVEGTNELKFGITSARYSDTNSIYSLDIYVANAQTDFDLVVQDSTSSEISLAIANIGKNTANSMIVRIPEQEGFKVSGTNGQMVGNLDSGDYTIVSFSLNQVGRNENPLTIQIDYTDNIGERRSVLKEIDFSSGSVIDGAVSEGGLPEGFPEDFEFGKGNFPGQKKSKWPYFLAIGLLLSIVGFFVYEKYGQEIKGFLKKGKKKISKEIEMPEWMIKEKNKGKV